MSKVLISGLGTTAFGNQLDRGIRSLAIEAIDLAIADAEIEPNAIEKIYFANAAAGIVTQQEMIRGQVALRHHALAGKPLINIENACASGGSALNLAFEAIKSGRIEVALVVGVEKLNHPEKSRAFGALRGATDIEEIGESRAGEIPKNSILMDMYAEAGKVYLNQYDAEPADFARIAVKNRRHAVHNPIAQFRKPQSLDEVLNGRMISEPLTLPMCAPLTDGAVALLVCSEAYAKRLNTSQIELVSCELACTPGSGQTPVTMAAKAAYESSGMGPGEFDLIELHDATAPAELFQYSEIGLCEEGQAHHLIRDGVTEIGGRTPVNTSGGLLSRGHALGATGCAQIAELCIQLRGRAGGRQVANANRGLAINGGGWLDGTYAVTVASIVQNISSV